MATGKSTVGKILADQLGYGFIDVDNAIEELEGANIPEIFKMRGEQGFRELEKQMVQRLSYFDNFVMALGGGAIMDSSNVEALRKKGVFVLLEATVESLLARTTGDTERPLLMVSDKRREIEKLLEKRNPVYRGVAEIRVDTTSKTPRQVADEILRQLEKRK
jgi:shikimate kinase